MSEGRFDKYADAMDPVETEDGEWESGPVYEDVGGGQDDDLWLDCEMTAIAEVEKFVTGVPEDPNKVREFAVAELGILEIRDQHVPPADPERDESQIVEGETVTIHNWLPRYPEKDRMTPGEKMNLAEVRDFAGALIQLRGEHVDAKLLNKLTEEGGKRVKGKLVGLDVSSSEGDDRMFYNPSFFSVNDDHQKMKRYDRAEWIRRKQS